jgi:hypothetical protein
MKLITLGLATATAFVFANSIPLAAAAELEGPRALAIELGAPCHDHAVLQRGMDVPVWGWSKPGTKVTGAWKNGNYSDCSAIAFAQKLHKELNVPVGILNGSFSQTSIQPWVPREGFATAEDDCSKAIHLRCLQTDTTTPEHKEAWDASWLFNGRLSPVVPYAIRSAICNQGYTNAGEGLPDFNNLHSLVRGWRIVCDKPELPVYFHQFYSAGMRNSGKEVNQPNLYNQALLPMTPRIYFDHQLVISKTWPDAKLKIAGETIDPATVGKTYDCRKMPAVFLKKPEARNHS